MKSGTIYPTDVGGREMVASDLKFVAARQTSPHDPC
jgi:hypothetical protein